MTALVHTDTSAGRTIRGTWFPAPFRPWKPRAYGVCFIDDGRIVLIRGAGDTKWYLPGGGVEHGETPEEGLVREVREEATAEVLEHTYLGTQRVDDLNHPDEPHTDFHYFYRCLVRLDDFVPTDITERALFRPDEFIDALAWGNDPMARELLRLSLR